VKNSEVYLGVGSNINPEVHIVKALELLKTKFKVLATSTFYQTRPLDGRVQDDYYNGVWQIETDLEPAEIHYQILKDIEKQCGREHSAESYSSRTIDLDLIVYGSRYDDADPRLPDENIYERIFIALPLLELAPELILSDTRELLADMVIRKKWYESSMIPLKDFTAKLQRLING
jgi:2-amino-4-hydroxy-6-hydroxymethyldihydropteridine diphosphokinase